MSASKISLRGRVRRVSSFPEKQRKAIFIIASRLVALTFATGS
jgi:hypothetical protein